MNDDRQVDGLDLAGEWQPGATAALAMNLVAIAAVSRYLLPFDSRERTHLIGGMKNGERT